MSLFKHDHIAFT